MYTVPSSQFGARRRQGQRATMKKSQAMLRKNCGARWGSRTTKLRSHDWQSRSEWQLASVVTGQWAMVDAKASLHTLN